MKRLVFSLVVVFAFAAVTWAEPPVRQVEVVNDPLYVDIPNQPLEVNVMNQPDPQNVVIDESQLPIDVNILGQGGPLEVEVVNQYQPVQYQYFVFETRYVADCQSVLDQKVAEGFELNFFTAYVAVGQVHTTQHYIGVMRKPIE